MNKCAGQGEEFVIPPHTSPDSANPLSVPPPARWPFAGPVARRHAQPVGDEQMLLYRDATALPQHIERVDEYPVIWDRASIHAPFMW
jgi:hypothetical protein